jgi:hypothetical protein
MYVTEVCGSEPAEKVLSLSVGKEVLFQNVKRDKDRVRIVTNIIRLRA